MRNVATKQSFLLCKFLHYRTNLTTLTPTNATFTTTVSSPNNSLLLAVCAQPGINNVTVGLVNTSSPIYDRSQMSCTQSKCCLSTLIFAHGTRNRDIRIVNIRNKTISNFAVENDARNAAVTFCMFIINYSWLKMFFFSESLVCL